MMYLPDVVTLKLDIELCNGCATCTIVCPHGVFTLVDKHARIGERDACMECGACGLNCASGAITVHKGVGCAYAVLNGMLGRTDACCVVEPDEARGA